MSKYDDQAGKDPGTVTTIDFDDGKVVEVQDGANYSSMSGAGEPSPTTANMNINGDSRMQAYGKFYQYCLIFHTSCIKQKQ